MPLEYGSITPWLDNWPIYRQLWDGAPTPGNELQLVPTSRNLTVQFRDPDGAIALASSELLSTALISVADQVRGIVKVIVSGDAWDALDRDIQYTCEILAYGFLYDSFVFSSALPESGYKLLNGASVYGAPREILELLGRIPGASVETLIDLSSGWTLNAQNYWTRDVSSLTSKVYGLWVNDLYAQEESYADLALAGDRAWARVGNTLYYKGHEDLSQAYVETAHNVYVLRSLQEATQEINRKTGTTFDKRRIYRELHRGTYLRNQIALRVSPAQVDEYFRLDGYSISRTLVRRYTEDSVFSRGVYQSAMSNRIFVDPQTSLITLTESFWDWSTWGVDQLGVRGLRGLSYLPAGDVAIEVTYTGGYEKPPTDIAEACANLAAIRQGIFWQQALTNGMQGLSIGCLSLNFGQLFQQWFPMWQQGADLIIGGYQRIEIEAF